MPHLLAAYGGVGRIDHLARLTLMRVVSDFREAMWGVLQQGISTLDVDFVAYAGEHFDRLRSNASTSGVRAGAPGRRRGLTSPARASRPDAVAVSGRAPSRGRGSRPGRDEGPFIGAAAQGQGEHPVADDRPAARCWAPRG